MPDRFLILGEAPGRLSTSNWSRGRIRDLAGRDLDEWAEWVNLVEEWPGAQPRGKGSLWNPRLAAKKAAELEPTFGDYLGVVCLGRRVAQVVIAGGSGFPFFRWTTARSSGLVAVIPHPSGIVRWWNEPENVEKARTFLSEIAATVTISTTKEERR